LCWWHLEEGIPRHSCTASKGQWCRCPSDARWWRSGKQLDHELSRLQSIQKR
jgi:hypothetical protein